jgi:hypothetical protein
LIGTLGSFVGECIIRSFGGTWVEREGWWGVKVRDQLWACPFSKIQNQFENGPTDSVGSLFALFQILEQNLKEKPPEEQFESGPMESVANSLISHSTLNLQLNKKPILSSPM